MWKNSYGLTAIDQIKIFYYRWLGNKRNRCLCGGRIDTYYYRFTSDYIGWERKCLHCNHVYDED